jgi:hypothetical protein
MRNLINDIAYLFVAFFFTVYALYHASLLFALHDKAKHEKVMRDACYHGSNLVQTDSYCMWMKFDQCFVKRKISPNELSECEKLRDKVVNTDLERAVHGD